MVAVANIKMYSGPTQPKPFEQRHFKKAVQAPEAAVGRYAKNFHEPAVGWSEWGLRIPSGREEGIF